MIHRLAIVIGSIAAAGILALGFVATGFGPAAAPADAEQPAAGAAVASATDLATPTPITRVETTTVYVRPAAKPKVIHVIRRASGSTRQTPVRHTRVVHVSKPISRPRTDDGGEREGQDD
jgi:hypothetical protein